MWRGATINCIEYRISNRSIVNDRSIGTRCRLDTAISSKYGDIADTDISSKDGDAIEDANGYCNEVTLGCGAGRRSILLGIVR